MGKIEKRKEKKMIKIAKSLIVIVAVAALAVGATGAYFSDTETSNGNTFTAGTLDLNVDGVNTNVVKFTASNLKPGSQPTGSYTLANVGSINGFLDIENIVITDTENGCEDPETPGDTTCGNPGVGEGELSSVLGLTIYWDNDGDGYYSVGDVYVYNGMANAIAGNYDTNKPVNAGANTKLKVVLNWWSTPSDNLAQNDTMQLDMTFELAQTTGQ